MRKLLLLTLLTALCLVTMSAGNTPETGTRKKSIIVRSGKLTRVTFEDSVMSVYKHIGLEAAGLSFTTFRLGMIGFHSLKVQGKLGERNIVTLIDFTRKSTEKRFYTVDLDQKKLLFHSLVSHGKNTGENEARFFSNVPHSNQSSLGFYITGETYTGSKGYSLRLDGVDGKFNDQLRSRAVVIHDAPYVSEEWIRKYGRLGRSQGCPALPREISRDVINTIRNKTVVFAYYTDDNYLSSSAHLDIESLFTKLDAQEAAGEALDPSSASVSPSGGS